MPDVELSAQAVDGVAQAARIVVAGTIDANSLPDFEAGMQRVRDAGAMHLVLDLGGVALVSSAGVVGLVKLADGVAASGGTLAIAGLQPAVRTSFELLGLSGYFRIFDSVDEAEAYIRDPSAGSGDAAPAEGGGALASAWASEAAPGDASGEAAPPPEAQPEGKPAGDIFSGAWAGAFTDPASPDAAAPPARAPKKSGGGGALDWMGSGGGAAGDAEAPAEGSDAAEAPVEEISEEARKAAESTGSSDLRGWLANADVGGEEAPAEATGDGGEAPADVGSPDASDVSFRAPGRRGGPSPMVLGAAAVLVVGAAVLVVMKPWAGAPEGTGPTTGVSTSTVPPTTGTLPSTAVRPATATTGTPTPPKTATTGTPTPPRTATGPGPSSAGGDPARLYAEALSAYQGGDDATARGRLDALKTAAPTHAQAAALRLRLERVAAGDAAFAAGDTATASANAKQVLTDDAKDPRATALRDRAAALDRARTAFEGRKPADARAATEALVKLAPDHAEGQALAAATVALAAAESAVAANEWDTAVTRATESLAKVKDNAWARAVLTRTVTALTPAVSAALADADLPRAEALAKTLSAGAAGTVDVTPLLESVRNARADHDRLVGEGRGHLLAGRAGDARAAFERAVLIAKSGPAATGLTDARVLELREKAKQAAVDGRFDEAEQALVEALAMAPDDPALRGDATAIRGHRAREQVELARRSAMLGDLEGAQKLVDAALAAVPDLDSARRLASEIADRRAAPEGYVYVPAGTYPVGSGDEAGNPNRQVTLGAYLIGGTEVTNAQYGAFVEAGGYGDDQWWEAEALAARAGYLDQTRKPGPRGWSEGRFPAGTGDQPVAGISWHEAAAFAKFAGGRLPTEEEWEVAAGYDPATNGAVVYPWGPAWNPAHIGLPGAKAWGVSPVGRRPSDRSPLGCADVAGNALEWTGSVAADGARVVRGGSALVRDPERECRVAHRGFRASATRVRLALIGFRLARTPGGGR